VDRGVEQIEVAGVVRLLERLDRDEEVIKDNEIVNMVKGTLEKVFMTQDELISMCENSGILWAEGIYDGHDGWWLHWPNPHDATDEQCVHVRADVLGDMEWKQVITFVKNGRDVDHVSRIVGYFAKIKGWNSSKLGELKDRQAGNYSIK